MRKPQPNGRSRPCHRGRQSGLHRARRFAIHCLNLRDGQLLWKPSRNSDDLYFAGVHDGKVLIVGKNYVRLVDLSDGKQASRVTRPACRPAARCLAARPTTCPPRSAPTRSPASAPSTSAKRSSSRAVDSAKNEPIGNLIFFGDQAAAQSVDGIRVYPQAKERE